MSPAECVFCGGVPHYMHHPTGRDHRDVYLDRELVLPVDHDCHCLVHDDYRHENLDKLKAPRTIVEYVAVRLRRMAMNLGRMDARLGGGTFWGLLADAMQVWADELDDHVRRLDTRYPGWRDEEGLRRD